MLFITGKDQPIYFPRQEHSIVSYGGDKLKHFATAIPTAAEGRYVMDRRRGEVSTVRGPAMLLPNPIAEVIVRRILSDRECNLYYPGNRAALEHNRHLRLLQGGEPFLSEEVVIAGGSGRAKQPRSLLGATDVARSLYESSGPIDPDVAIGAANLIEGPAQARRRAGSGKGAVEALERGTSYTQPRTITLDTKFDGVITVCPFIGYAVMVVKEGTGQRRVVEGTTEDGNTILLDYDERLEPFKLSTGTPKSDDRVIEDCYLRTKNNQVSDEVNLQTADHVPVRVRLSMRVNFEGDTPQDKARWFHVENYVKLLTDHVRSVLIGVVKATAIEQFHSDYVNVIRDAILGPKPTPADILKDKKDGVEGSGARTGMFFHENNMRVTDVEILNCAIGDDRIEQVLREAQYNAVTDGVRLHSAQRSLHVTKEIEEINRQEAEARAATIMRNLDLAEVEAEQRSASSLAAQERERELAQAREQIATDHTRAEVARENALTEAALNRTKARDAHALTVLDAQHTREVDMIKVQTSAAVERLETIKGDIAEGLKTLADEDLAARVAEALSPFNLLGGKSLFDVLGQVFGQDGVSGLFEKVQKRIGTPGRRHASTEA